VRRDKERGNDFVCGFAYRCEVQTRCNVQKNNSAVFLRTEMVSILEVILKMWETALQQILRVRNLLKNGIILFYNEYYGKALR